MKWRASSRPYPFNFLKAAFHKFYLVRLGTEEAYEFQPERPKLIFTTKEKYI